MTPLGLRAATAEALDGVDAPRPTGPAYRPRASAVLVLLGEDPFHGPYVLVLQRAATLRNHAGQIAFPGGAADPEDTDAIATALREAAEEVGLDPSGVRILATLPPRWVPASNYLVTPVLAWWATPHEVRPVDDAEVARVDRLTIAELAAPANRLRLRHPGGWIGPAFRTRGMLVWGFTAGVLSTLLDLGGWAQPWPTGPIEELHRSCDPPVL
ncbi:MAG: CoA pyrophosphatase [Dactylosporangium sp.]|nr:CoA pyrophosphatase [Dactylosporangium sp.]NNJ63244.1 CoA pyrophosphatase [Dactylosporangium sp.]